MTRTDSYDSRENEYYLNCGAPLGAGRVSRIFAKAVRWMTVAPFPAAALILLLYFLKPGSYKNGAHALLAIFFLSVLPLCAYPLSMVIPAIRKKGRDGQRDLAIACSVLGYIGGCVTSFGFEPALIEKVVYLTYALSGVLIALLSGVFHVKASGHACGVAGPIAALTYFLSPYYLLGLLLFAAVCVSSLVLRRHTLPQLIIGACVSCASLALALCITPIL